MKISVIVPVYNVERYLEECIESLLHQTTKFYEIILINDGSTDQSLKICKRYSSEYPEIKLIDKKNQGLAVTRNLGIKLATGDYIIFVDSDDYIQLGLNSRLSDILQNEKIEVLYYNAKIQYDISSRESQNTFRHSIELNGHIMTGMEYFDGTFPENYTVSACIAAYKCDFLRKYNILFPEGIYFEDHYFSLQIISNAETIICIPDSLYIRRCREGSIMNSDINEKKCLDIAANQRMMWKYLKTNVKWNKQVHLLKKYISSEALNSFYKISCFSNKNFVRNILQELSNEFLENWYELFEKYDNSWCENLALYLVIKRSDWINKVCIKLENNIKQTFLQKMEPVLANKTNIKIGIYGIGNHTKNFLEFCFQDIEEIQHEIFFIVSSLKKDSFLGKPIYDYRNVPEDTDYIILSSKIYQNDMKENLIRIGVDKNKIISLYNKEDICDLVMMNWVFSQ